MHTIRFAFVGLFATLLAACNPVERADEAREQIDRFHQRYNAGDIDAIWANLGGEFKEVTSRGDFDNLMAVIEGSLGEVQSTEQAGINMDVNPNGSFTVVTMQTEFFGGGGTETFTFSAEDDGLSLIGYNLDSPELMSDMMSAAANAAAQDGTTE